MWTSAFVAVGWGCSGAAAHSCMGTLWLCRGHSCPNLILCVHCRSSGWIHAAFWRRNRSAPIPGGPARSGGSQEDAPRVQGSLAKTSRTSLLVNSGKYFPVWWEWGIGYAFPVLARVSSGGWEVAQHLCAPFSFYPLFLETKQAE